MNGVLCRVLALYPHEGKRAFLFAFLGFLWAIAVTLGLKYSDVMFLTHVGADDLPTVYTCVSCSMILLSAFTLRAYHYYDGVVIFLTHICAGIVFYSFILFCFLFDIGTQSQWLWFLMKCFATIYLYLMLTAFWSYIDHYHEANDAKRLFGIFTSVIFLGSSVSGLLLRSGFLTLQITVVLVLALLIAALAWLSVISRHFEEVQAEHEIDLLEEFSFIKFLKSIWGSRYIKLIVSGNFFGFLLWVITEYNYMTAFQTYFDKNMVGSEAERTVELAQFFGQWVTIVSVVNLIFGLFIYTRIVRRFGIGTAILFIPTMYLLNFSGWLMNDSLLFPLIGFFIVEGMIEITEDTNTNLMLKMGPVQAKSLVRVVIQSFFEPLGMLMSGILLSISDVNSIWLGLCLSLCALAISMSLKIQYFSKPSVAVVPVAID